MDRLIVSLVQNTSILVALAVLYDLILPRFHTDTAAHRALAGLLFGLGAIVGMMTPIQFAPGVIYDGRSIILAVSGLFLGPAGAIPAAVVAGTYRLWLGGAGSVVGTLVILEAAALGVAVYYLRRLDDRWVQPIRLGLFALLVHLVMALLQLLLPGSTAMSFFRSLGVVALLVMPAGQLMISLLFLRREEKMRTDQRLRESEERYRSLFVQNHTIMLLIAPETGEIVDANPAASAYYQWSSDKLRTLRVHEIHEGPAGQVEERILEVLGSNNTSFDARHRLADGTVRDVEVFVGAVSVEGRQLLFTIVHDIGSRKEAERSLQQSLEEKEVLIRELHHRVKNNLTVMAALINLQLNSIESPEDALRGLQQARDQIMSMGHVHKLLYQHGTLSQLDFAQYLQHVVGGISENYGHTGEQRVQVTTDPVILDITQAVPAGLITNELVANALRNANGEYTAGTVSVHLRSSDCGKVRLSVLHTGAGIAPEALIEGEGTSRFNLVQLLTDQISGNLSWDTDAGTRVDLEFEAIGTADMLTPTAEYP
jgi:PAS domain S-box-containing protein